LRKEIAAILAPLATAAYARISGGRENFELRLLSGASDDFARDLAHSQKEETRLRQTVVGPHRDDLAMLVDGNAGFAIRLGRTATQCRARS